MGQGNKNQMVVIDKRGKRHVFGAGWVLADYDENTAKMLNETTDEMKIIWRPREVYVPKNARAYVRCSS